MTAEDFWQTHRIFAETPKAQPIPDMKQAIKALEVRLQRQLPTSLRSWLRQHPGGAVSCPGFVSLLGVDMQASIESLQEEIFSWDHSKAVVAHGFLPIGYSENDGSYLCVNLETEDVALLDHELEIEEITHRNFRSTGLKFEDLLRNLVNVMEAVIEDDP